MKNDVIGKAEKYYHSLIEASLDPLVTISTDGIITYVNSATENAAGLPREKLIGTDFSAYFSEPEKARILCQNVFEDGKVYDYELNLNHIDGEITTFVYNAAVFKDDKGNVLGAFASARDITASRKAEDELKYLKNNLELLVKQRTEELVVSNRELVFQSGEIADRAAELLIADKELTFQSAEKADRAAELIIADKELTFQSGEKADRAAELLIANKELTFQSGEKADRAAELLIANKELAFQNYEKEKRAAELLIANKELAFQNREKEKRATELLIANKELAFQNERISYLSYHDYLTGLYNRAFFEEEKKRLDTQRQLPLSVIMGDINGLKLINDGFGHAKGDSVLVEISGILQSCGREEDIIARIGGDEFVILLPHTDSVSAQLVCNRIYDSCREFALEGKEIYPSISLGHATKTTAMESMDDVLIAADESMSRQKLLDSRSAHSSIISSIKVIMFEKSQETQEHAERLIELSRSMGLAMFLSEDQLNELELLSTLHDIGKMGISASILSKREKLSNEEWSEMRKHPEVGFRIAQSTSELLPIAKYILCHHERWDGKGYPQGLEGDKIPLLSRILAIADAYDAMTNDRAYRAAISKKEAIEEIRKYSGT